VSYIPPGHFPSRAFPPNPNHKPNPNSNPNSYTIPKRADPTLTLLTSLLTLTLTKQGIGGNVRRGIVHG